MSLDVTLRVPGVITEAREAIFVREAGATREMSREEWDSLYPGREPTVMTFPGNDNGEVYTANITHNLNKMAEDAGIYKHLWRPEEINIKVASELVEPLTDGLILLASDPNRFKQFNPDNGWGDYEGLLRFVADYLGACRKYPQATVEISR